jgi:putative hydrolase of the HAD superfamily
VLTTSVFESFAGFCEREGLPPSSLDSCLREDTAAGRALVELECGRIRPHDFEEAFAGQLTRYSGVLVRAKGLIRRMTDDLELVPEIVEAISAIRQSGIPTILVSNSLGDVGYDLCDLRRLFDDMVISGDVGVRKPSRAIYRIALERAGVPAGRSVLVDDLAQNIAGAARLGMHGLQHREPAETIERLRALFAPSPG